MASDHRLPSTAEPAWTTTAVAPTAAPRRNENARAERDFLSVSGAGEPKLIR